MNSKSFATDSWDVPRRSQAHKPQRRNDTQHRSQTEGHGETLRRAASVPSPAP